MRMPKPLLLTLLVALAGCTEPPESQGAPDAPTAEDFEVADGLGAPWQEPVHDAAGVVVRVEPSVAEVGQIVQVSVENRGTANHTIGGSRCGIHVARPQSDSWVVFGVADGHQDDILVPLPPGETCRMELDLSGVTVMHDGRREVQRLPPSDYRVVWLSAAIGDANGTALASSPLRVTG